MLGPVRMMKGALPPPSSMSLGTKAQPAPRCSPADGCLSPFALKTCAQSILTRQPASQAAFGAAATGSYHATAAGAASQSDHVREPHCALRTSVHLSASNLRSQHDLQRFRV